MNDLTTKEKKIVADAITEIPYETEVLGNHAANVLTKITGKKYVAVAYDNFAGPPYTYYVEKVKSVKRR